MIITRQYGLLQIGDTLHDLKGSMNRIRVGYVDHAVDVGGGAQEMLLDILRYCDRDLIEPVLFVSGEAKWLRDIDLSDIECHEVFPAAGEIYDVSRDEAGRVTTVLRSALRSIGPVRTLRRAFVTNDIDIVHTNTLKCHVLGGLAARLAHTPLVWDLRDILSPGRSRRLLTHIARLTRPHIAAMSSAVAETMEAAGANTTVVLGARPMERYEPVDPDLQLRQQVGLPPDAPVLSIIARLSPWKGHRVLLRAFRQVRQQVPNAHLLVVGDPGFWEAEYEDELKALAGELGLADTVHWLGFREDVQKLLALTDVVVLPSENEPFGMVLVEAMAAGKPVIATRAAGPLEIVKDGETGLLVEIGAEDELAEAVERLLSDAALARKMGQAGRKRALEHFDVTRLLQQLYDIYRRLL